MDVPWIGFPDTHNLDVSLTELGNYSIEVIMGHTRDSYAERLFGGQSGKG